MEQRTSPQNRSLHKWLDQKSAQCREAGVSVQMAFSQTVELEFTPEIMKEVFRTVMKAMYGKQSTRELNKSNGEIEDLINHINRFFAEKYGLDAIPLPSNDL